ncbi:tRNA (N6-isopentenyl adenosine(37)-C2)-methylthiotransferase MiaB [Candidatus Peregrinibacteria bacterium]|nr:tRNA (N6-isopentenyl adenosine(37)-C2)-methylthiotransferase MiaB [Candidatus Peregrinibacteria bacterium]
MNYSDSERTASILETMGYEPAAVGPDADLLIVNTCSVRQKAEDRTRGHVRHWQTLRRKNKNLAIGLTGCMVRKTGTRNRDSIDKPDPLLTRIPDLDFVFRIEDLPRLPNILKKFHGKNSQLCFDEIREGTLDNYFAIFPKIASNFQVYLPVMTGCDHFCTFCIVPYTRGRERSRPMSAILAEAKRLVKNGAREITLLGQKVNGYGQSAFDKKSGFFSNVTGHPFAELLKQLNTIRGIRRIRFTSSHPEFMTDELISTISQLSRVCHAIHLPVQSGSNTVLSRMNRRYTREKYISIAQKIRSAMPDCAITTDIIVGFCGETDEEFQQTLDLFEIVRFDMAYLAEYSPRKGTVSEKMMRDDVPQAEKTRRWHALNDVLRRISFEKNREYEGRTVKILVESTKKGLLSGKTDTFKPILFPGNKNLIGGIVSVMITKAREWVLEGVIAPRP